jgi:hypothetical protein
VVQKQKPVSAAGKTFPFASESTLGEDLPEWGWVWKRHCGKASRTKMGKEMDGKGMEHRNFKSHSPAFPSGRIGLRLRSAVACAFSRPFHLRDLGSPAPRQAG